jgi:N-acetylmuramic acid 6-phosphate etherase
MLKRITEAASHHNDLEKQSTLDLLTGINTEDKSVPLAVEKEINQIAKLVDEAVKRMELGGRLFYLGAGTSGRLGIVDASECPPTFGVPHGMVIGLIAGGDQAIRKAVEFAEDDREQGWKDLEAHQITTNDIVVGIAASGTTPYVLGALEIANSKGILTGGISCNPGSPLSQLATIAITPVVGPEFVTGSTRMKSGTAQKLVLNMLSTAIMIRLGRVKGNRMVDMQLSNDKLVDRGTKMVMEGTGLAYDKAAELLKKNGSVRKAIDAFQNH